MRRVTVALAALVSVVLGPGVLAAEHEVYYRYTVIGYVKDERGRPVQGRDITIVREKTGFSYLGETDARGLYVVVLRLGDESVGERLTVRTGGVTMRLTARFDVANRSDERGTRLDLDNGRFVERAAWFPSTLALYLGTPAR